MSKLQITRRRDHGASDLNMLDAVQSVTTPYVDGTIEAMRERMHLQERLIANLLMVVFNDYGDEYTPGHEPKNRAEQLAFVLNVGSVSLYVNEV